VRYIVDELGVVVEVEEYEDEGPSRAARASEGCGLGVESV
jgi:hypothetical protein